MKKFSWFLPALVVLIGGCIPYYTTETPELSGRVEDAVTGQPVMAKLHYEGFSENVVSSSSGKFEFPPIRRWEIAQLATDHMPGQTLIIEADGYKTARAAIDLGGGNFIVIKLDPQLPH